MGLKILLVSIELDLIEILFFCSQKAKIEKVNEKLFNV